MAQPQSETKTEMVAPQAKTKIKLVRDAVIPTKTAEGQVKYDGDILRAGAVVEVEEWVAKDLCDTLFDVQPQYRGERVPQDPENKNKIFRAVRVS